MKFPFLLTSVVAVSIAAPPARADYAADMQLLKKFAPVLQNNDVEGAKALVAAPNFRPLLRFSADSYTIFEQALNNEQPEIARLMMNSASWKKTRWNSKNSAMPLIFAAAAPNLFPILQDLARQPHFDVSRPGGDNGDYALDLAANKNNMSAIKWLVRQPRININSRNKMGQTALFDAGTEATKYLISLDKMDVNARNKLGQTALHNAVEMENVDKVRVLLSARGINPNLRDANETPGTPLDLALRNRNVEIASALISNRNVRSNPAQRALLKRMGKKS